MAVYTKVPQDVMQGFIAGYPFGALLHAEEILQGIENSNFFITTPQGKYVLTLFEKRVREDDLPFFIDFMRHIAGKNIPCPLPLANTQGQVLQRLMGRPAILCSFLQGAMTTAITPLQCQQVGALMARMHEAVADFKGNRENNLSLWGWQSLWQRCAARAHEVAPVLPEIVGEELAYLAQHWPSAAALPRGVIHADLFDDNVFFKDGTLYGVIDFYFSCTDFFTYDLAITLTAWCFDKQHHFVPERGEAMLQGYHALKPLSGAELQALPLLLRGAALRFLLTRLHDWLHHPEGAHVKPKDPLEYLEKLTFFRRHAATLTATLS